MNKKLLGKFLPVLEKASLMGILAVSLLALFQITYNINAASTQPDVSLSTSDSSLASGETATVQILVKNEEAGNTIEDLRFRAFFENSVNPSDFEVSVKADSLSTQNRSTSLSVPIGHYLDYVEGSSKYHFGKEEAGRETSTISDINGVSPLAFEDGFVVNNVSGGENSWAFVTFKVKAVAEKPVVFHPDLEFFKYVANVSEGEDISEKNTSTNISDDDVVRVQLFIHNQILESTAHGVTVEDEDPATNSTLTGRVRSDEDGDETSSVRINSTQGGDLNIVPGSVVVKDLNGTILKTLTSSEVDDLFSEGLSLNGDGVLQGCWEFMRRLEYKVTLTDGGGVGDGDLSIDKKVLVDGEEFDSVPRGVRLYDINEAVDYEIEVQNTGDETVEDVEIEDVLPTYLDFVSSSSGSFNSDTRVLTFDLGDLNAGESRTVSFTARVKEVLPQGDRTQENLATVCGAGAICRTDTALIWIDGPEVEITRNVNENINRNVNENENVNRNENTNTNENENINRNEIDNEINNEVNNTVDNQVTNEVSSKVKSTVTTKTKKVTRTKDRVLGADELPVDGPMDPVAEFLARVFWEIVR